MYSINDLRKKLELAADDLDLVLNILNEVLVSKFYHSIIVSNQANLKILKRAVMKETIDDMEYIASISKIRVRILELIAEQLVEKEVEADADEREIAENWNDLPIVKAFFEEDDISEQVGEELDSNFNSLEGEAALHEDIHEPGDNIPKDEARRFKKLMSNIQDEIRLGEASAYQKCKEAAEIIHDSAQVFELLMLAFLNLETSEKIIENALNGNTKSLKQLEVYVDRIEKYNKAKSNNKTKTDKLTKKYVATCLIKELAKKYKSVQYDYSRDATVDKSLKEQQERAKVKAIIDTSLFIYNKIQPTTFFLHTIQLEIISAGKFSWKKNDFNIDDKWRETMEISKKSNESNSIQSNLKKLNDSIYLRLKNKFTNIKPYYFIIVKQREDLPNYYLRMTQIIQALKSAYDVTGKQEMRFLEIILDELTGNKNNGKLRWFHLSLEGDLTNHDQVPKDFNASKELEGLASLSDHSFEEYEQKILLVQKEVIISLAKQKIKEEKFINCIKAINVNDKIISRLNLEDKKFLALLKQSIQFLAECWDQLYGNGELKISYTIAKDKAKPSPEKLKIYQNTIDLTSIIQTLIKRSITIKSKVLEIDQPELIKNMSFFDEVTSGISVNEFIWVRIFTKIKDDFGITTNDIAMTTAIDLKKQVTRLLKLLQLKSLLENSSKKSSYGLLILQEIDTFISSDLVKNLVLNSSERFYLNDQYYSFPSEKLGFKKYDELKQHYSNLL